MSHPPTVRRVLAVIPARGGSKGVPAKNLAPVGGVPLVVRAVRECRAARHVTDVVVSTDDQAIAAAARQAGAEVVLRPAAIAGDTATSEAAVLHAMDAHEALHGAPVDVVLLVQCTSPFLTREDIDGVTTAVTHEGADTAVTVAPFHGFLWRAATADAPAAAAAGGHGVDHVDAGAAGHGPVPGVGGASAPGLGAGADLGGDAVAVTAGGRRGSRADAAAEAAAAGRGPVPDAGAASAPEWGAGTGAPSGRGVDDGSRGGPVAAGVGGRGVNHDKSFRPRRQDRPQDFLETGAAYAMDAAGFRVHRHRFFGRTELVRTDPARVLEIDDPHDLARARALAPLLDAPRPGALPTADDIDAVVLDFDGTQTDDRVLIDSDGRELVSVHRGDGLGIAALRRSGLKLLVLSTEQNPVVAARARKLQLPVLHGIDRKDLALKQWCEEQGIAPERVLYAGNDVNDLPCFALVGWPVAVASAHDVVRGAARAVTTLPGGAGAIREIAGWILGPSLDSLPT
ncbi:MULTISPECIES: N-acylneuraminate cytidylyltransferase [unclassified Streptomyces]|uniref:N-acylneuraminate cytidylyltransferase n=1 Tax=unclassified Streptomyces TaxID=2593676 RepID=UPI000F70588C|nr:MULTISPECIES: N-acylneuraminate cytidylyltransferase [unclassified Streptomyces]AZM60400.1 transferase [Streptomyces sp. WAC 01438]RSM89831.1 transferase [Streptomyces sp. WAC 01420]